MGIYSHQGGHPLIWLLINLYLKEQQKQTQIETSHKIFIQKLPSKIVTHIKVKLNWKIQIMVVGKLYLKLKLYNMT